MNRLRRFVRNAQGSSAVEFVLVLPLLMILLFAFFEAGRIFWSYNVVSSSARDAARYAARLTLACSGSTGAISSTHETQVQRLARTGTIDGSGAPLVTGWTNDASVAVSVSCIANPLSGTPPTRPMMGRFEDLDNIPVVRVQASAPFQVLFGSLFPTLALTAVAVDNGQVWTE